MGSQVFGNLIAAFVLGEFPQIYYVLIMFVVGLLSCFLLFFLIDPVKDTEPSPGDLKAATASPIPLLT